MKLQDILPKCYSLWRSSEQISNCTKLFLSLLFS